MESGRSLNSSRKSSSRVSWRMEDVFTAPTHVSQGSIRAEEDEEALIWAALAKLPTYDRLRTSIMKSPIESSDRHGNDRNLVHKQVDVRKLEKGERTQLIDEMFKLAEEDNEKFLRKFRERIDR
ncbi:hypothetical protein Ancab_029581 [Ancistrocladus abbreviatus]